MGITQTQKTPDLDSNNVEKIRRFSFARNKMRFCRFRNFKNKIEIKQLATLIQNWAKEKGIDNIEKQELKLIEELGELAKEINLGNKENQKGEI